jgi:hypothetical protein
MFINILDSWGRNATLDLDLERYEDIRQYMISKDLTFVKGYLQTTTDDFRGRPVVDYYLYLEFKDDTGLQFNTKWEMSFYFNDTKFVLTSSDDTEIDFLCMSPECIPSVEEDNEEIYSDYISDIESCN